MGGCAPTVLNAANEVAVQGFLDGANSFLGITEIVERTLESIPVADLDSLDDLLAVDREARELARRLARSG